MIVPTPNSEYSSQDYLEEVHPGAKAQFVLGFGAIKILTQVIRLGSQVTLVALPRETVGD